MADVKLDDLTLAFDFVGSAPPFEHIADIKVAQARSIASQSIIPIEDEEIARI
jgi:hypothetical protein